MTQRAPSELRQHRLGLRARAFDTLDRSDRHGIGFGGGTVGLAAAGDGFDGLTVVGSKSLCALALP